MSDKHGNPLSPRRNLTVDRPKLYEEMLLKEISVKRRTNEPMHAVLEAELGENGMVDGLEGQSIRNHALIHYLATLANSNNTNDTFDFDFVESLLKNGADINSTDKTGQAIFHEVARSWNTDVATFLLKNGANVNQKDNFGRSPLHVAAAVDYADMVEFLLQNGADINISTNEEGQTPVHFSAKNDAINSLQMLLAYGADIDSRDSKNRTPLQVSAQMNRSKAAKHLINEGAPVGVCDDVGNSALSLLIEKIPEVALEALDQFHSTDSINRKHYYFLNYLEGTKLKEKKTPARTPLEIAVQNKRFDIILHPVMQRLISVKWKMYGKWGAIQALVLNLVYTILWSVIGVSLPKTGREMYEPLEENIWRLVIGILLILLTIWEIKIQIMNTIKTRQEFTTWREWRANELERDFKYCHPRWPQENEYLQSEIKGVRHLSFITDSDWWIYFDWVALLLILATIVSHVTFFYFSTNASKQVHQYIMILLLLILWLRIFKYARPFEGAGPFVVIFGSVVGDILKWAFLNLVILIPYTCAFWIIFGAYSLNPVDSYSNFSPLLYNMFSMMVVDDHDYKELEKAHATMARLLCGTFIIIVAIVTVNLLIALLSNTFERHYENAVANAVMQRARTIQLLRKSLGKKEKAKYYDFIRLNGSPEVIWNDLGRFSGAEIDERATIERVREDVQMIMHILGERLGKRFGKKGKKSDMEFVKMDVCKLRVCQEELVTDTKNIKIALNGIKEMVEFLKNNNNNNNYNNNINNNNDNNNNDNSNNDDDNGKSNATNINVKTPNTISDHATSSTAVNASPIKKATLGKNVKKIKSGANEDNSETEDSSTTQDSSESSSENDEKKIRRKKSSKNQDKREKHQKKKKDKDQAADVDESRIKGTKDEFVKYPVNQQFQYYPEDWQPPLQGFGGNNRVSHNTYPPMFSQTTSSFSPWRRNQDDQDADENQRYHVHRDLQPNFNEFNKRSMEIPNEFEFSNSCRTPDESRGGEINNNIPSSPYYIQRGKQEYLGSEAARLAGRRLENNRVHQPVFLQAHDTMNYPRNASQMQNVQTTERGVTNYGSEQDGWENQRLNHSYSDGQERYIEQQHPFTNYRFGHGDSPSSVLKYRPNLNTTGQEFEAHPSRSAFTRLTETRQPNPWSEESIQAQSPRYQEMYPQSPNYRRYDMVPQKLHLTTPPKRQPLPHDQTKTTTKDGQRILEVSTQIQRSPMNREYQVDNLSEPPAQILTQTQLPIINVTVGHDQHHLATSSSSSPFLVDEQRQGNIHESDIGGPRRLVGLSAGYIQGVPGIKGYSQGVPGIINIQTPTGTSGEPSHVSSSVQNLSPKNQNAALQVEPRPIILSRPSTPLSHEIMEKVDFYEGRKSESHYRIIPTGGMSFKASTQWGPLATRDFQHQMVLDGDVQPSLTPSPIYPSVSHENYSISTVYPTMEAELGKESPHVSREVTPKTNQGEMDDNGFGREISETTTSGQRDDGRMSDKAKQSQNDSDMEGIVEPTSENHEDSSSDQQQTVSTEI